MRISFDLDDTLIPGSSCSFLTEKLSFFQKLLKVEKIRRGTKDLFKYLKENENEVGIYTTSYRSAIKIRFQFLTYGIKLDFIINEKQNRRELKKRKINSSKYPLAFDIDIHIDDSKGVGIEGERLNFRTIIIDNSVKNWIEKIKSSI